MSRWNGVDDEAPTPKFRTVELTKAGLIAAVVAAQARPQCGHLVCGGRDHCLLAEVES